MSMLSVSRICYVSNALVMLRSPLAQPSSSSRILGQGSMLLSSSRGRTGVPTRRKSPPPPVQQLLDEDIEERFVKASSAPYPPVPYFMPLFMPHPIIRRNMDGGMYCVALPPLRCC